MGLDFKGFTGGINIGVVDGVGESDVVTGSDVQVWNDISHALVVWLYNIRFVKSVFRIKRRGSTHECQRAPRNHRSRGLG